MKANKNFTSVIKTICIYILSKVQQFGQTSLRENVDADDLDHKQEPQSQTMCHPHPHLECHSVHHLLL